MKIGIVNNAANYLPFNVNLARYLVKTGFDVTFLNPDKYISKILNHHGLKTVKYPDSSNTSGYYSPDSSLIRYFHRVFNFSDSKKLITLKNREYYSAFEYLKHNPFDFIIILNGAFSVETEICQQLNIKTYFFEHGYFPQSIQMDRKGVNCLTEFANLDLKEFLDFHYEKNDLLPLKEFQVLDVKVKTLKRIILRTLDPGYWPILKEFYLRKSKLKKAEKRFRNSNPEIFQPEQTGKYIFWPLQVNSDTQIILNSEYESMYDALEKVIPDLKKTGYKIILKEHPMEVEPVDYSKFIDNEKVFLVKKSNLEDLIDISEFVVNINSSVGLQAISRYKKVLILGESFYHNSPLSFKYQPGRLSESINELIQINVDKDLTDKYINHFKEEIFIRGHFYNPDPEFLYRIVQRITG